MKSKSIARLIPVGITVVSGIFCFATPYWIRCKTEGKSSGISFGLWIKCTDSTCQWIFDSKLQDEQDAAQFTCRTYEDVVTSQDWFIAVQGLMTMGITMTVLGIMVASMCVCSSLKKCHCTLFEAGIMLTGFLSIAAAVTLFGIKLTITDGFDVALIDTSAGQLAYGWSFWLAVGSGVMSLISSLVYGFTRAEAI